MRFSNRLLLGATAIVVVTSIATVIGVRASLRGPIDEGFVEELAREARVVAAAISSQPIDLNLSANRFGVLLGRRVTFIDEEGRVVGDSDFDDASLRLLQNHRGRPEVQEAFDVGLGVDRRLSASTNRMELKVAIPSWPGIVRISAVADQADRVLTHVTGGALRAGLVSLVLAALLALLLARSVTRPVKQLSLASRATARGDSPTFPFTNTPEIRELVRSFRSMHGEVTGRIATLERERAETTTMLDAMVQGILATDERGSVTVCNRAMRSMLGFQVDDRIPGVTELFHRRGAREVVERAIDGETVVAEEVSLEGGAAMMMSALPLPNGGVMLGLLDVSDVRRVENVRRDFVANVSHELKTPLTSILGYASTLVDFPPDPETARTFLQTIRRNAERMQALVDDLLSLARVESGAWTPRPEEVDVFAAAQEVWGSFAEHASEKSVSFVTNGTPGIRICADRGSIQQILTNLFDNALRYSKSGGSIRLTVEKSNGSTIMSVADNGSGIPAEHLPRVFERFYRADPGRSREEGGTGLGLSIVKHLIETQGGKIEVQSELSKGTTITVRMPDQDQVSQRPEPPSVTN